MTFYFGGGYKSDSDPGTAFVEGYKKSRLGKLLGDAYSAPKEQRSGLLGQIAQIDPQAAQGVEKQYSERQAAAMQQLQGYAKLVHGAWKSGNKEMAAGPYAEAARLMEEAFPGFKAGPLDDTAVDVFGQIAGLGAAEEEYTLTPGSARFRGGKQIASVPYQDKPQAATFQKDAEGNGWWLRPGEAPIPADSPAAAGLDEPGYGAAQFDPQAFVASVGSAISPLGGRITSTTGGQHNAGSKHYSGGAVDVGMGRETPEQQARILQALQAQGLNVRDERQRPPGQKVWGGPHLHVEPGQQTAQARRINFGKAEQPKDTYRTLGAKEVQALGLPAGTVAQMSPSGQVQIVNKPNSIPGGQTQVIDNGDGTQTIIPAGKTTEDQNKSAGYALRMEKALKDIAASEKVDPSSNRPGFGVAILDALPTTISNYGKSGERQNVEAAQLDALDAALTLNTGAAYTKEQLYGLRKSYFPQPGDEPSTIKAKRSRLEGLIQTARLRARGAYPSQGQGNKPAPKPAGRGPTPGTVENGYRFKGGNPADPNAWERI